LLLEEEEEAFDNGDYQDRNSSSSRVSFSNDVHVLHFSKVGPSEWGDCFYDANEMAVFRHDAWVEQCTRNAMGTG
jgi:hypothetical protein